jgi:hypothetical protein
MTYCDSRDDECDPHDCTLLALGLCDGISPEQTLERRLGLKKGSL